MSRNSLPGLLALWMALSCTPAAATERVYYFHNDHLGTPQAMSDAAGRTVWTAEYEPFGTAIVNQDPDGDGQIVINNLRFPGQYYDAETGLHYNYHRDYDPATGRYLTPDPIGLLGGPNQYSYVLNNPLRFVDPSGLALADYGGWGFPTAEEHLNRNGKNYCPKTEPKQCKNINKDPGTYSNKYRDSSGNECSYDANGNLLADKTASNGEQNYSYNYAPGGGSFFGELFSIRHYIQDVAPHYYYKGKGLYPPNLTRSGESCECQ